MSSTAAPVGEHDAVVVERSTLDDCAQALSGALTRPSTWLRVALIGLVAGAGCRSAAPPVPVPGGSAVRGAQSIAAMGCGACHQISGIAGASGLVGPPLDDVARRGIIAGQLANTPANMIQWIRDPQSVSPGNAMPNLGIDEQTARDITAYLYSQH